MSETITAVLIGGKADGQKRALPSATPTLTVAEYDGFARIAFVRTYHRHEIALGDKTLWLYVLDGITFQDAVARVFEWYVDTADRRK